MRANCVSSFRCFGRGASPSRSHNDRHRVPRGVQPIAIGQRREPRVQIRSDALVRHQPENVLEPASLTTSGYVEVDVDEP